MAPFIPSLEGLLVLALRGRRRAAATPQLNTVQHHDMHHRCVGGSKMCGHCCHVLRMGAESCKCVSRAMPHGKCEPVTMCS
jgi:hypothetical protein